MDDGWSIKVFVSVFGYLLMPQRAQWTRYLTVKLFTFGQPSDFHHDQVDVDSSKTPREESRIKPLDKTSLRLGGIQQVFSLEEFSLVLFVFYPILIILE